MTAKTAVPAIHELIEYIGQPAVSALVRELGGTRLYIPHHIRDEHVLPRVIGHDAAEILSKAWGGETLLIPRCTEERQRQRDQHIAKDRADGETVSGLALRYKLTERTIYDVLRRIRLDEEAGYTGGDGREEDQLDLFVPPDR